ncbi:MAG: UDP-N-acetylmuramoyl-L-alanine--D-glutamate ligase [Hyphomicrobiales bacterium]|nr:UDP-N-acetylmuramoyl-L-alanine--D-glutamate ligase [Hyphomicrobiales bacterium]
MPISPAAKSAAIWGFGREGRAAYDHLAARRPDLVLTILDDAALTDVPDGASVLTGADATEALRAGQFGLVVKSPGISFYRDEIAQARAKGTVFTSITNLWFDEYPNARTVVVTGTKGKSTTSRLIHHLLTQGGLDVRLLGNVGVPALGQTPGRDWTVLELSSYQLADFEHAPDIAVLTNLYPEHAPWHGGVEPYYRDKLLAIRDEVKTLAVPNGADAQLRARLGDRPHMRSYNDAKGFHVRDERLFFADTPVEVSNFPLRGAHNLANLAAACTVADLAGLHDLRNRVDLAGFEQLHHRLEEFHANGITCIDDSISTVPQATLAALAAYPGRDIVLLLGGSDRGQDYTELVDVLATSRVRALILLPVTGARIHDALKGRVMPFNILRVQTLAQAVEAAMQRVPENGVVMLSPAAPSFEEFRNFEERGRRFKELCAG